MENIIKNLIKIENELKKRNNSSKIGLYNKGRKVHKKQILFHKCKKRNRWVFGGNRSGKTECGAVECVYLACGIHPYRKNKLQRGGLSACRGKCKEMLHKRKFWIIFLRQKLKKLLWSLAFKTAPKME